MAFPIQSNSYFGATAKIINGVDSMQMSLILINMLMVINFLTINKNNEQVTRFAKLNIQTIPSGYSL